MTSGITQLPLLTAQVLQQLRTVKVHMHRRLVTHSGTSEQNVTLIVYRVYEKKGSIRPRWTEVELVILLTGIFIQHVTEDAAACCSQVDEIQYEYITLLLYKCKIQKHI